MVTKSTEICTSRELFCRKRLFLIVLSPRCRLIMLFYKPIYTVYYISISPNRTTTPDSWGPWKIYSNFRTKSQVLSYPCRLMKDVWVPKSVSHFIHGILYSQEENVLFFTYKNAGAVTFFIYVIDCVPETIYFFVFCFQLPIYLYQNLMKKRQSYQIFMVKM